MDFLTIYLLPFTVVLTVIVFFHELGHYLAARWNGVKVEAFSIGFGPELFGYTDKHATRWKFCLVPLGGYVKMFSDENVASQPDLAMIETMTEEQKKYSLAHKSVWARIQVSAAGPLANFIFAIFALTLLYSVYGQKTQSQEPTIGYIVNDSPAKRAGLQTDDRIVRVNGVETKTFQDIIKELAHSPAKINLEIKRGEQSLEIQADADLVSGSPKIGIMPAFEKIQHNVFAAGYYAVIDSYKLFMATLKGLGQMFAGKVSAENLSGPIGIAKLTGEFAAGGLEPLIFLMVILSINLGLINLLPIPMLDGGHLLFYCVEAVTGKPVSAKVQEYAFRFGAFLLLSVLIFTTIKDLEKLSVIKKILNALGC